jgi:hypothetical protein
MLSRIAACHTPDPQSAQSCKLVLCILTAASMHLVVFVVYFFLSHGSSAAVATAELSCVQQQGCLATTASSAAASSAAASCTGTERGEGLQAGINVLPLHTHRRRVAEVTGSTTCIALLRQAVQDLQEEYVLEEIHVLQRGLRLTLSSDVLDVLRITLLSLPVQCNCIEISIMLGATITKPRNRKCNTRSSITRPRCRATAVAKTCGGVRCAKRRCIWVARFVRTRVVPGILAAGPPMATSRREATTSGGTPDGLGPPQRRLVMTDGGGTTTPLRRRRTTRA